MKNPENQLWIEENGSIYVAESHFYRSEFPGQKENIEARRAIAFNVGSKLGRHIVEIHNEHLKQQACHKGTIL